MTLTDPLATVFGDRNRTPQSRPANSRQVKNNAGGFTFVVDDDTRLRRFLVLGTTGGTYYQGEQELTKQNADMVVKFAAENPIRLVEILTEISVAGRAPKQNPTIFALAAAASSPVEAGRKAAFEAMPLVLRTASHLTMFADYLKQFRGWGSGLKRAGQRWYNDKDADQLAYQLTKYRTRNGFSQRDLLRVIHPKATDPAHQALYRWVTQGDVTDGVPRIVQGFLAAQQATSASEWAGLVREYGLSWEMLPDAALSEKEVWNALLDKGLPLNALIRQLPRLTNLGIVGSRLSKDNRTSDIVANLTNQDYLQKSRIHPFNVLVAQWTYKSGRSLRGSSMWSPEPAIVRALDKSFRLAFTNVVPAEKRTLIGLDVSGSMTMPLMNSPITARAGSAAMSLITAATEPQTEIYGFTSGSHGGRLSYSYDRSAFTRLDISGDDSLPDVIRKTDNLPFSGTDCALPMIKALELGLEVDTFVVYTDSETWAGSVHPHQALKNYRNRTGIPARLVVVGMTATDFTIADQQDSGMLDVVGFDSAAPALIADFSAGRV
jgi:60 kDa SS-A/Ro ribonucleoprotein